MHEELLAQSLTLNKCSINDYYYYDDDDKVTTYLYKTEYIRGNWTFQNLAFLPDNAEKSYIV